ncbi:MAG: hypothetical protein AAF845_15675 [Bacteroidota bacterium]
MTMLLLALALSVSPAPASGTVPSGEDPHEGLYACSFNLGEYVFWLGEVDGDKRYHRIEILYVEDYPYGTKVRHGGTRAYRIQNGVPDFPTNQIDFEGGTLNYDSVPCTRVSTLSDILGVFGVDPAGLAQELADIEGYSLGQATARLEDAAFAYSAFAFEDDNLDHTLAQFAAGVTLPEPPPPPTPVPGDAPRGSDAYAGIYVNAGSTPRLYLVREGRLVLFTRRYNPRRYPVYPYAYEVEDALEYTIQDGAFDTGTGEVTFAREGDRVVGLAYRRSEAERVYTLRQLIEVSEWDPQLMVHYLTSEHGLSEAEAEARLDDAQALDRALQEGDGVLTFADLAGVAS